ncbi:MAG: nucleotide sugar dehydrogenase [Gammaproteobacteria bacterium]|nr:nucleotide sugar dehydrogenase [Gammaproteobacteria bacterium]
MNQTLRELLDKISAKTITIGVVGLGYVGLPFLVEKAKVGLKVIGIDQNPERVNKLARGENYIDDVDDDELKNIVHQGLVTATSDIQALSTADVIVICVPTPLDKNLCPDLRYVVSVSEEIARCLRRGQLISLESTTYPGTTEEIIQPILEQSGLKAGEDFFLAHSPERVDPGNKRYSTKNTNKVVGGVDANSLMAAESFYKLAIQDVVAVSSAKAAELVKIYENTFRAVNIALANEVALLCDRMNLNVWEVLDAAFTKPFGIMPFYPGPGVGGHCIPIDPHYLEWKAREYNFHMHFIALAGETNRKMPDFVVSKISRVLNSAQKPLKGSKILLLGMAYKADVADHRESPAIEIFRLLKNAGANVSYHDRWVDEIVETDFTATSCELSDDVLEQADLVLITTNHTHLNYHRIVKLSKLILDTRYATRGITEEKIVLL